MTTHTSARPVVALDFDGVLNPLGFEIPPGYVEHKVHAPLGVVPESPFIRGYGREALSTTVRVNPDHGRWIDSLLEVADVVWATTWEEAANVCIAPLLGIDPLPVGISVEKNPPMFSHVRSGDSSGWKSMSLADEFRDRALVWVDDMNGSWIRQAEQVHQTRHLFWTDSEYYLEAARRYAWDNHADYAPKPHFEDTWAESGRLVRSAWSAIGYNSPVRFPTIEEPEDDSDELLDWRDLLDDDPYAGADKSPTMAVNTVPEIGLTPGQMEAISRFVHQHANR